MDPIVVAVVFLLGALTGGACAVMLRGRPNASSPRCGQLLNQAGAASIPPPAKTLPPPPPPSTGAGTSKRESR